jgi:hypothetical protein
MAKAKAKSKAKPKARAKKTKLQIVANGRATNTLAELCRPAAQVAIQGTVTAAGRKKVLLVESVQARQNTNVAIVASKQAQARLADVSTEKGDVSVALSGRLVDGVGGSALVLDQVNKVQSLPLIASAKARQALSKLAESGRGEVSVKAKVQGKGENQMLVLDADADGKKR